MIGTLHSEVKTRRERGNQILQRAQSRNAQGQTGEQIALRRTIATLNSLVETFLDISSCQTDPDGNPLSIKARFPGLRQLVPCNIIIPFQDSMIVTLPTDPSQLHSHKPFPSNLVTFKGFEDTIELMNSVARPRKLVIEGSDGRKYRFLCKPMDDLRKDNRLMDCTSLINRLLMKDAGSRKRSLRTSDQSYVHGNLS
jgi:serine/threonine-protein kinase ATR